MPGPWLSQQHSWHGCTALGSHWQGSRGLRTALAKCWFEKVALIFFDPPLKTMLAPPLSPHLTDLSAELDTMRLLSGLMVTLNTVEVCPSSSCIWAPLAMSHTLRV